MVGIPDTEEVKDFVDNVNEVSMLIEGLKAGTITPDYIDRKHAGKLLKDTQQASGPNKDGSTIGTKPVVDTEALAKKQEEEEARKEKLMEKAKELQANRERKLKARQRYDQYVQASKDQGGAATDYQKWGMWCPDDEEDDLFNSLTPNNPAFRALEKDIDERHNRMVEQRQIAERQRVAGNEAFKTGQYSEALRCYQTGLDSEKTNMALHANAAQAALKLSCFVQAIEHCGKVLNIADFLHNNPNHPLCAKAYMRRSMAYRSLGQYERAVEDITAALEIQPGDKELMQIKSKADLDLSEHIKQKELNKALKKSAETGQQQQQQKEGGAPQASASSSSTLDVDKLRRVEQLVVQLKEETTQPAGAGAAAAAASSSPAGAQVPTTGSGEGPTAGSKAGSHAPQLPQQRRAKGQQAPSQPAATAEQGSPNSTCAAAQLERLLHGDDRCCVYFRECGGIAAAAQCIAQAQGPSSPDIQSCAPHLASYLTLLNTAAVNDGNLLQLSQQKGLVASALAATTNKDLLVASAAASLLCTAATRDDVRKHISTCLSQAPATLTGLLKAMHKAPAVLRGLLLLLLSNCAVDTACKAGLVKALGTGAGAEQLVDTLSSCVAKGADAGVAERALTLVANMCGGEELRGLLSSHGALASAIAAKVVSSAAPPQAVASQVCRAAATALFNLAVDAPAQQAVTAGGHLPALLQLLSHPDMVLVTRVAGTLARCLKQPAAATEVMKLKGIHTLVQLATDLLAKAPADAASGDDHAIAAADAAVRGLTLLVASSEGIAPAEELLAAGGGTCLRMVLSSPVANQATKGNAALCVAHVAKHPSLLQPLASLCKAALPANPDDEKAGGIPSQADAQGCLMAALVRAAYQGQGTVVSKNAGIALARLAGHKPLLERLRDLRGLEIIHASIKKL